ncbi:hypothetical protein [Vibrio agarivorans]|uniref:hypothetical protein n=1 Tax=Vibrio agarivorans TaxID=153622 RepID=UPI002231E270|nr:hypothetical protein [Vibrio agarivorans]
MIFNYKTEDGTRDTAETKYLPRIGELFMHHDNYHRVKKVLRTLDVSNVCIAVICSLFGFYMGAQHGAITDLDIIEVIGVIISISTLIIASQALNSWRNQFKHNVEYESFVKAESNFKKYWDSECDLRAVCIKKRSVEGFDFEVPMLEAFERNAMQYKFLLSWNELEVYHPKFTKDFDDLNPDILSRDFRTYVMKISEVDFRPYNDDFCNWSNEVHKRAINAFLSYRKEIVN